MYKPLSQIKREKKDYIRGTLANMVFWGNVLYYLWIVRLRVDVDKDKDFPCYPYDFTLKVQVVNPWNPLAYLFALWLVIAFLISNNINIRKANFKDWKDVFKFE